MYDSRFRVAVVASLIVGMTVVASCTSTGRQGAASGAVTGAAAGAVGAAFSAAIFGGDVGDAAARGAAYGAGTGAVTGAIKGDKQHKAKEQQELEKRQREVDAEIAKLKKEIGEDAYSGLAALTEGKHEIALGYARTAKKDKNEDFALAGYWLEAITYTDAGDSSEVERVLPELVEVDQRVDATAAAKAILKDVESDLDSLREEFGITTS